MLSDLKHRQRSRQNGLIRSVAPMAYITLVMLVVALITSSILGMVWIEILISYMLVGGACAFLVFLVGVFLHALTLIRQSEVDPIIVLRRRWSSMDSGVRLTLCLLWPLFLSGFTATKIGIVHLRGFHWDAFLSYLDFRIFGVDPWVPLHQALGGYPLPWLISILYWTWAVALFGFPAIFAFVAPVKTAARFFAVMAGVWAVGGVGVAYWLSSAGPVFAHLFDPTLLGRFQPLIEVLRTELPENSPTLRGQAYLAATAYSPDMVRGGGISAMPSMHVAQAALYACALWQHAIGRWIGITYALLIWLGSVMLGYHYVTDGLVSIAIVAAGWWVSGRARLLNPAYWLSTSNVS